jgi:hypothetical protein
MFHALIFLIALWPLAGAAQDIDFSAPCPNPDDTLSPIDAGVTIGTPITIGSINAPGSVTMEIRTVSEYVAGFETPICGTPCSSPVSLSGVEIAVTGTQDSVEISGTPDAILAGSQIRVTLRASSNGQQCDRSFALPLPVERVALDLAVILDKSGSMSYGYDGSFSPPSGERRWDGLLVGVGVMTSQLDLSDLIAGDGVGMRFFDSSVVTPNAPFNAGLVDMEANIAQIPVVANQVSPGGSTALGDGIKAGRDILLAGDPSHRKVMIVFSDGVQNSGDQVQVMNPNAYTQTVAGEDINGPADEINIYTISLGSSGHNPGLMESIATENGGEYLNSTAGAEAEFTTFFSQHVVNILNGSSPQQINLIKDRFPPAQQQSTGTIPPTTSQTFSVNKGVSQVQVTLIAPNRLEPGIVSLQKDGVELIQQANIRHGNGFTTLAIDYPINEDMPGDHTLDGEWIVGARLGANTKTPTPYTMMMLVDDHLTDLDYNLGGERLKVGQSVEPSVGFSWKGKVIDKASVQAIMLKPGEDINDLLATTDVDFSLPDSDPGSPDKAKLAVLMQDQAFLEKIAASEQVINLLFDASDERYKGSLGNLDVAGVYQLLFRLDVDSSEHGHIVRFHRQSFNVRSADIDLASSALSFGANQQGQTVISLRPRASNGKYIGPGWGPVINLESNVEVQEIVDHGDGSYHIITDDSPSGAGSITVDGELLFEGDLASLACYGEDATLLQRIGCWLSDMGLPPWSIWLILLLLLVVVWLIVKKR